MKKINDFLPEAAPETVKVQGSIRKDLHALAKKCIAEDRKKKIPTTWDAIVDAGVRLYIAERRGKSV